MRTRARNGLWIAAFAGIFALTGSGGFAEDSKPAKAGYEIPYWLRNVQRKAAEVTLDPIPRPLPPGAPMPPAPPFVGQDPEKPFVSEFATAPAVRSVSGGHEITFATKGPTDVAVEIVAADETVVRHLAAGVLGANPPAPLAANSFGQTLRWDGKDDQGQAAAGGPFTVRVRLGLKPTFERLIHWEPQRLLERVNGIAVDDKGVLYVLFEGQHRHHAPAMQYVVAYDRNGKYLRQIMPMPANLKREQIAGVQTAVQPGGRADSWQPVLYRGVVHNFYPYIEQLSLQQMALVGSRLFIAGAGLDKDNYSYKDRNILLRLPVDGSVPADFIGPLIGPSMAPGSYSVIHLAASPDGKTLYATGLRGQDHRDGKGLFHHVVYRGAADLAADQKFEPFYGEMEKPGAEAGQLNDPCGLAVDKDGNLYICDSGNNRLLVLSPDKRVLRNWDVKAPKVVLVHPRNGAVYVVSSLPGKMTKQITTQPRKLLKYASLKADAPQAEFDFRGERIIAALDASGDTPAVWLARAAKPTYRFAEGSLKGEVGGAILKIVDRGDTFESLGDPVSGTPFGPFPRTRPAETAPNIKAMEPSYISVDRRNEIVMAGSAPYLEDHVRGLFDGRTGKPLGTYNGGEHADVVTRFSNGEEFMDPRGRFLVHQSGIGEIIRLTPDGRKRLPFEATGRDTVEPVFRGFEETNAGSKPLLDEAIVFFSRHQRMRGVTVAPNGDLYVAHHIFASKTSDLAVSHVTAGGQIRRYEFITSDAGGGGVRVDRQGNVYTVSGVYPANVKDVWPLASVLPDKAHVGKGTADFTRQQTGSLVKFGAKGGHIIKDINGPLWLYYEGKPRTDHLAPRVRTDGDVQWLFFGAAPCSGLQYCVCEQARFDLDGHDRLFVPEATRYSVAVLDTQGNFICRFGQYGNMDSRGPGSPIATPEIPFAWPMCVAASDSAAYVGDFLNYRIVKVALKYQTEKSVPVR